MEKKFEKGAIELMVTMMHTCLFQLFTQGYVEKLHSNFMTAGKSTGNAPFEVLYTCA